VGNPRASRAAHSELGPEHQTAREASSTLFDSAPVLSRILSSTSHPTGALESLAVFVLCHALLAPFPHTAHVPVTSS
jgi:hypothetical protein